MSRSRAKILREVRPLDEASIHGVTFDGRLVWFARNDELVAFDPVTERVVHRHAIPGVAAGTAFDGENLYQLAGAEILVVHPESGRVLRRLPSPGGGKDSGMAYADGFLWVGQFHAAQIHKVDATTGAVVGKFQSDRFVTGVSCIGGSLWHAVSEDGKAPEVRRLDENGAVLETWTVPVERIAGMESDGQDHFWCAGEKGKLRLVGRDDAS